MKKYLLLAFVATAVMFSGCGDKKETTYTAKTLEDGVYISADSDPSELIGPFVKRREKIYNYKDENGNHSLVIQSDCLGLYTYDYIMMSNESVNVCDIVE